MATPTKEGINQILSFLPDVSNPSATARASWSDEGRLLSLIGTLNSTNFVYPFDYNAWLRESGIDLSDTSKLDSYDLETMRKLMTAQIRIGRFSGGHIQTLLNNGYLAAFLTSLKRFA